MEAGLHIPAFELQDYFSSSSDDQRSPSPERSAGCHSKKKRGEAARKRQKKHRREADKVRRLERRAQALLAPERSAADGLPSASGSGPFYFDSHGDKDNLAYDSIYRHDTPAYQRWGSEASPAAALPRMYTEVDGHWQGLSSSSRYYSAPQIRRERDAGAARTRPVAREPGEQCSPAAPLPLPEILPLQEPTGTAGGGAAAESVEEYILRRTREFNERTRADPCDVQLWLDYANFQEQAVAMRQHRKHHLSETAVAEKRLAILEAALQHAPSSESLLLAFMDAMAVIATPAQLLSRWRKLLAQHGSMPGLWDRYILLLREGFSTFTMSALQSGFGEAVAALGGQAARCRREGAPREEADRAELTRVRYTLEALAAWLQAGHTEHAVAGIQALLEFSVLAPPLPPVAGSERTALREFKRFWGSGAPRIGEPGAVGWSEWAAQECMQELRHPTEAEGHTQAETGSGGAACPGETQGGWSSWRQLASVAEGGEGMQAEVSGGGGGGALQEHEAGDADEGSEGGEGGGDAAEEGETEEELLARLGMKLDAGLDALGEAAIGPETLQQWVAEETSRCRQQWRPVRAKDAIGADQGLERAVEVDDVAHLLVRLDHCPEAQERLVLGCLSLLGAPLGQHSPSNDPAATRAAASQEAASEEEAKAMAQAGAAAVGAASLGSEPPTGPETWLCPSGHEWAGTAEDGRRAWWEAEPGRRDFLVRALHALLLGPFPGHWNLALALFRLEAAGQGSEGARGLLALRRDDLTLWAAYGAAEAERGRLKAARKVFAAAMASAQKEDRLAAAPLALECAEMELRHADRGEGASLAAIVPLVWLGSNESICAKGGLPDDSVVSARKGFQAVLPQALATDGGRLNHSSAALIAAAALFEALAPRKGCSSLEEPGLSPGLAAALAIHRAARDATSSEVRVCSVFHEQLQVRLAKLLMEPPVPVGLRGGSCTPRELLKPRAAKELIQQALRDFPSSPALLSLWARLHERLHHMSALRRSLAEVAPPGGAAVPLPWLLLLQAEFRRPGGGHLVTGTLERCLGSRSPLRSCPMLWRVYLAYHVKAGRLESAKKVFLRGIHECPWSKALWLDGFHNLRSQFSPREAEELLETCREKEVFLRTDVFEVLLAAMDSEALEQPAGHQICPGETAATA